MVIALVQKIITEGHAPNLKDDTVRRTVMDEFMTAEFGSNDPQWSELKVNVPRHRQLQEERATRAQIELQPTMIIQQMKAGMTIMTSYGY